MRSFGSLTFVLSLFVVIYVSAQIDITGKKNQSIKLETNENIFFYEIKKISENISVLHYTPIQSIIGIESRKQILDKTGSLPNYVLACVGGGSNAIGIFSGFIDDLDVSLIGIEASGEGIDTEKHAAT